MVAVTSAVAVVSTAVDSVVVDTWQVELAIAEAVSALAECVPQVAFRALKVQDTLFFIWASIPRAVSAGRFFCFASGDCKAIGSAFLEPSQPRRVAA